MRVAKGSRATAVPSSAAASGSCAILAYVHVTTARNLRRTLAAVLLGAVAGAGCAAPVGPVGVAAVGLQVPVSVDREASAAVPEEIRADGILDIGTDPDAKPMEYFDSAGRLTGVDIQLAQAVAAALDLRPLFVLEAFTALESGVRAGRFDLGVAAIAVPPGEVLDTDSVLYLSAGTMLARSVSSDTTLANLCGRPIAALEGSTQLSDLANRSRRCESEGSAAITVVAGQTQEAVTRSVLVGDAEAMIGDSPAMQSSVRSYPGELDLVPGLASPAPLVMLTPAGNGFADVVSDVLDTFIADGTYEAILASGGLTEGGVAQTSVLPAGTPMPPPSRQFVPRVRNPRSPR